MSLEVYKEKYTYKKIKSVNFCLGMQQQYYHKYIGSTEAMCTHLAVSEFLVSGFGISLGCKLTNLAAPTPSVDHVWLRELGKTLTWFIIHTHTWAAILAIIWGIAHAARGQNYFSQGFWICASMGP